MAKPEKKASATVTENPAAVADPKAPRLVPLLANEIWASDVGVRFNNWEAVPPPGTPLETIFAAEFWKNVAQRFTPGSTIKVYPADGAWYAELLIWDAGRSWARVAPKFQPLERPAFGPTPELPDQFEVRYHPSKAWQVIEKSSGRILKDGCTNPEDARSWILDHQKAMRQ